MPEAETIVDIVDGLVLSYEAMTARCAIDSPVSFPARQTMCGNGTGLLRELYDIVRGYVDGDYDIAESSDGPRPLTPAEQKCTTPAWLTGVGEWIDGLYVIPAPEPDPDPDPDPEPEEAYDPPYGVGPDRCRTYYWVRATGSTGLLAATNDVMFKCTYVYNPSCYNQGYWDSRLILDNGVWIQAIIVAFKQHESGWNQDYGQIADLHRWYAGVYAYRPDTAESVGSWDEVWRTRSSAIRPTDLYNECPPIGAYRESGHSYRANSDPGFRIVVY